MHNCGGRGGGYSQAKVDVGKNWLQGNSWLRKVTCSLSRRKRDACQLISETEEDEMPDFRS